MVERGAGDDVGELLAVEVGPVEVGGVVEEGFGRVAGAVVAAAARGGGEDGVGEG